VLDLHSVHMEVHVHLLRVLFFVIKISSDLHRLHASLLVVMS
jgi:hypothetical protein